MPRPAPVIAHTQYDDEPDVFLVNPLHIIYADSVSSVAFVIKFAAAVSNVLYL